MRRSSSNIGLLAGGGTLVGVYVALGFGFYWLMQPTIFENSGRAAYKPPPATIVVYRETPFIPPTPTPFTSPSPAAIEPPVEAAFAAATPAVEEQKPAVVVPKQSRRHRERTTYRRELRTWPTRYTWGSPFEFRSMW
jgi:hypothetical protein